MTDKAEQTGILVPIDIYGVSRTTLEMLVAMAEHLNTSLFGLILEDSRLQQVAKLPFAREIVLSTGLEREFYMDSLIRLQQTLATEVRRMFDELAASRKIQLQFETSSANRSLRALMREGMDVFFPARQRRSRLQATVPSRQTRKSRRLGILYDRGLQASRAIDVGKSLVSDGLVREVVLIAAGPVPMDVVAAFAGLGARACIERLAGLTEHEVTDLLRRSMYDIVLVPRDILLPLFTGPLEAAMEDTSSEVLVLS